jgi:glycosyltransferase involved in cell wall biosynthesis
MKIAHIIPGDLWAGAEAQVFYTLKELNTRFKYDIIAILFNEGELYKRLSGNGIRIFIIDERRYSGLEICRQLENLLKTHAPDVIHVHEYKSHILTSIAVCFSKQSCKIVRTIHGLTSIPFDLKCLKASLIFLAEYFLLMFKTDCIVAVSRSIEAIFKKRFKRVQICQINNAIHFPLCINKSQEQIRNQFGISHDTFWIGSAARYVPVKNLDMLIEAARLLQGSNMNYRVSIFGEGYMRGQLQEKIDRYKLGKTVWLHGHHEDILPVLKALDVFVLTSKHEGLPISLLEAMAVGTIPVCTNVGGMQEVIENNKSGFLLEPNDVEALVDRLVSLHANKLENSVIKQSAIERIRESYSIEKTINSLNSLYQSIGFGK